MAMLCALPVNAQNSDDFFCVGDEYGGTRDAITYWTATNGIGNNGIGQSEAPVGSGLLILTAVGAGYAIYRRKHNFKNGTTLLLAFALLLGMTQCKKNVETINPVGNGLHITLRVDGGSRANVTPGDEFATVTFEEGDVIYVGYNNACLGSLTYNAENQKFGGDVAFVPQVDEQPLHFYFLGNKTPTISGTQYTVDIIDQTSKYPVISYNRSNEVYTGAGEYSATLFNYCSFMKFTTDNIADINSQVLCITGMNNTVTVDFNGNDITYGIKAESNGLIKMPTNSGSNVRWAIVLPQDPIGAGASGSVYTADDIFEGSRPAIDEIERNQYLTDPININLAFDLANESYDGNTTTYTHIYQSNSDATTSNTITIADGQTIYLHGVNIKAENTNAIVCEGNAEIVLCGTNTVTSESDPQTSGTLNFAVIKAGTYESTKTTLTISGDGSLNAYPVYRSGATSRAHNGAVIGADYQGSCGNIVINSGTITVSTNYGAAIGAGAVGATDSKCGTVTINGGTVNATSGAGAGIGCGRHISGNAGTSSCDGININGGTITARSSDGAAIGSGKEYGSTNLNNNKSYCAYIFITGGTIDAQTTLTGTSNYSGAAIGGGYNSVVGTITISGGVITARGGSHAAGIGSGGYGSRCGNILINGGTIDATGGYDAAGIGTGSTVKNASNNKSTCGTITITSGVTRVTATKGAQSSFGTNACSIGQGYFSNQYCTCGTVTINGSTGGITESPYTYQP